MSAAVHRFPDRYNAAGELWEPWVGEGAVARHFGVSGATIRRWRQAGMPSRKFEGVRRYRLGACERWHEERAS